MFTYARKTLINGLTTIFNCIILWNTSIWHNIGDIRELSSYCGSQRIFFSVWFHCQSCVLIGDAGAAESGKSTFAKQMKYDILLYDRAAAVNV